MKWNYNMAESRNLSWLLVIICIILNRYLRLITTCLTSLERRHIKTGCNVIKTAAPCLRLAGQLYGRALNTLAPLTPKETSLFMSTIYTCFPDFTTTLLGIWVWPLAFESVFSAALLHLRQHFHVGKVQLCWPVITWAEFKWQMWNAVRAGQVKT